MQFPLNLPFGMVRWDDANSPAATEVFSLDNIGGVHGTTPIITAGWILKEDPEGITLAAEFCGGSDFRGLTHVRRPMILEVVKIKPPRQKKIKPINNKSPLDSPV